MENRTQFRSDRLAVLIDADNASAKLIEPLLKEIAKYGTAHVKRIYGDWTSTQLNSWKDKLNKFAIQPMQQFRYSVGKNSTDSALIIDAMDLLYTQNFDGFCIISSDSDFTRLASRIRESGLIVYGFGEKKTPEAFVSGCDKFIYTEILEQAEDSSATNSTESVFAEKDGLPVVPTANAIEITDDKKLKINKKLIKLLTDAYDAVAEEDGWANLGPFGGQLTKLSPSFDSRNYGYKKLSELVRAVGVFEIKGTKSQLLINIKE
ncbi:NYN domain-containing protein [Tumidithrix elongata]